MSRLALVCALVGIHGVAGAQPLYPRPQPVPVVAAPAPQVRPPAPTPPAQRPRPAIDAEAVLTIGPLLAKPRAEQEAIYLQLIADTPDTEAVEKSEYLFRLGELYSAQSRAFRLAGSPKSKDALLKAVRIWKQLTDNETFRTFPKLDVALFEYAYTLQGGKYLKEARAVYDKLLKNFPQSIYVPEAHLAFAEYYVTAGQLDEAEARYRMVLKFPKSAGYAFAMYRLGWIYYDLVRHQDALETFFQVIQLTKNDKNSAAINDAAKAGFVETYAEIGKPDKAMQAFARVDPAKASEMVEALAERDAVAGKPDQAVFLYRQLIKAGPTNKDVCRWQVAVARSMMAVPTANAADKAREVENLVKLHMALEKAKTLPAQQAEECSERAAAMSSELARSLQGQPAELDQAERLYKVHAEGFPDDDAPTSFADLLWSRAEAEVNRRLQPARWAAAADAYLDVARTTTDPQRVREAATLAVLAWKNGFAVDPRPMVQAGAIDLEASARAKPPVISVPPEEAKLAAAFAIYDRSVTDRDELARAKFLLATLHRRHGDHAQAVGALTELLAQYRDHETSELAANLALDSLIRMHRFDDVLALVDQLAADAKFLEGKPALQANIKLLRSRSLRRR